MRLTIPRKRDSVERNPKQMTRLVVEIPPQAAEWWDALQKKNRGRLRVPCVQILAPADYFAKNG